MGGRKNLTILFPWCKLTNTFPSSARHIHTCEPSPARPTRSGLLCFCEVTKHRWHLDKFSHRNEAVNFRKWLATLGFLVSLHSDRGLLHPSSCYVTCSSRPKLALTASQWSLTTARCVFPWCRGLTSGCDGEGLRRSLKSWLAGNENGLRLMH